MTWPRSGQIRSSANGHNGRVEAEKGKIFDSLTEVRETQTGLEAQRGASDQVIAIYEPDYEPGSAIAGHKSRKRSA